MSLLDAEELWKEVWTLFDQDGDGYLSKQEFTSAVRVLGKRYTNKQMEERLRNFAQHIDYDTYFAFMCDPYEGPSVDDLRNALKAFDEGQTGTIKIQQLNQVLTNMGEKLSQDEARSVLGGLPTATGTGGASSLQQQEVSIEDIVAHFTPSVPSVNPDIDLLVKELIQEEIAKSKFVDDKTADETGFGEQEEEEAEERGNNTPPINGIEDVEEVTFPPADVEGKDEEGKEEGEEADVEDEWVA